MYGPHQKPPFHRAADDLERKPPEYLLYTQAQSHKFRGFPAASDQTFGEMKAAYYGMVSQIYWQVGLIVAQLQQQGLAEDALIVFTSDHGMPAKGPFLLDCMLQVPLLIAGPGVAAGRTVSELVEEVDLFPTISSFCDLELPPWLQGQDLSQALAGQEARAPAPRERIYAEAIDKKCIRTSDWKYIHYPGKAYGELYDLRRDPHELYNLFADQSHQVARMRAEFYQLLDDTEETIHPSYDRFEGVDPRTGTPLTHYHVW